MFDQVALPDAVERGAVGRRARSLVSRASGKYSRHRLAPRGTSDLALDATLRAAAARTGTARPADGRRLAVESGDLRRKVRTHRSPFAVVFVVDNSYSIHADQMVERVKGLALELLEDATARGDRVALVCFKGGVPEGTVAMPLTRSMSQAHRKLAEIPLSGRTPLADAVRRARLLLRQETVKHRNAVPVVVIISDGLPTVPIRPGGDPLRDLLAEARRLRTARIVTVVADAMPPGGRSRSCAPQIAEEAGGVCIPFAELAPSVLKGFLDAGEDASLSRRSPR